MQRRGFLKLELTRFSGHIQSRMVRRQHDLYECSLKVPRLSLVFHNLTSL